MTSQTLAPYLRECLSELERALGHLDYSAKACGSQPTGQAASSEETLAAIEAFTSRFARVVDLMTKRALRAIDEYEMYEPGSLLDVANRAEKRGIVGSVDWLRELKDTRNRIAHDYAGERLQEIYQYCRKELPRIFDTCQRIKDYGESLLRPKS